VDGQRINIRAVLVVGANRYSRNNEGSRSCASCRNPGLSWAETRGVARATDVCDCSTAKKCPENRAASHKVKLDCRRRLLHKAQGRAPHRHAVRQRLSQKIAVDPFASRRGPKIFGPAKFFALDNPDQVVRRLSRNRRKTRKFPCRVDFGRKSGVDGRSDVRHRWSPGDARLPSICLRGDFVEPPETFRQIA
jgi:hypothetical protein